MNSKYKHSDIEFQDAVKSSTSIRQVLQKLNIVPAGGNYSTVKRRIKNLKLDTSHFTGQGWSHKKVLGPKLPLEYYLTHRTFIKSNTLKLRLIKEGFFKHQCNKCKQTEWLNNPIPIELHHKNGDHYNNDLNNLEILCPNCHSFTDTYRRRKK